MLPRALVITSLWVFVGSFAWRRYVNEETMLLSVFTAAVYTVATAIGAFYDEIPKPRIFDQNVLLRFSCRWVLFVLLILVSAVFVRPALK